MRTRVRHEGGFGRRSATHDELRSLAISLGQLLLPGDRYGCEWTKAFSALTAVLRAPQVPCSRRWRSRLQPTSAEKIMLPGLERRHVHPHGRGRAHGHLHRRGGHRLRAAGRHLRQEVGGRPQACCKPPRASRRPPAAAALDMRSQEVLSRTVPWSQCVFV